MHAAFPEADPLAGLPTGQQVGLIAIDFVARRRLRVNGELTAVGDGTLRISVEQAYGNCPQYIQQRALDHTSTAAVPAPAAAPAGPELTAGQRALVAHADTFFLGTVHPTRGTDSSHRGGSPGFVRVEAGGTLWWPDYPGNNMFNSLGNLAVDETASLLFTDWGTGATLHLHGTARLEWTEPGAAGDDGGTGRRVRFSPTHVTAGAGLSVTTRSLLPYPRNPGLTD